MIELHIDERIHMSLPRPDQAKDAAALVRKNLDHLKPWMPWAVDDYSLSHAETWITLTLDGYRNTGNFSLFILDGGAIIGCIGIHELERAHAKASIGYWIDADNEGRGIVTRCCRVLIDYLFDTMELNRVQINCNVENRRSRAVPERLGFTLEGNLRETEFVNGSYRDWAIYGLLKRERGFNRI